MLRAKYSENWFCVNDIASLPPSQSREICEAGMPMAAKQTLARLSTGLRQWEAISMNGEPSRREFGGFEPLPAYKQS